MMFDYINKMMFFSGIQAELKAQYDDQNFVNRICQTEASKKLILDQLFPNRASLVTQKRLKYFVSVCEVLAQRLALGDVSMEDQLLCAKLLEDRYNNLIAEPLMLASVVNLADNWRIRIEEFASTI